MRSKKEHVSFLLLYTFRHRLGTLILHASSVMELTDFFELLEFLYVFFH